MSVPFEIEADRQAMLEALGQSATYTPSGGVAKTINVIYDNDVEQFDVEGAPILGEHPEAKASTADLTGTVEGGALVVGGRSFIIKEFKPDGTGMTTLSLSRTA